MTDLTRDSIFRHILMMAAPVVMSMFAQIAYQLVNLYFVTRIGVAATAGVVAAGNVVFVIAGLAQVLVVGTVALVAHAIGRKDPADAHLVFNQSLILSAVCSGAIVLILCVCTHRYLQSIAADSATVKAGATYVYWALPGYAVMLSTSVLSASLRGAGIVRPVILIYISTILIDAVLAPILIAGWGTGIALGVRGAGLATSLSMLVGFTLLGVRFRHLQRHMVIQPHMMRPNIKQWLRVLNIGLPAGAELLLVFLYAAIVYYAIRDFGASAQAGFGIGSRVLQIVLLPGAAIAFAAGPIVGQNFGARNGTRVKETFRQAALVGTLLMVATTLLVQWQPRALVRLFDADASSIAVAVLFLQLMSWSFVAQGIVFTCGAMFQGFGNTIPSLISAAVRILSFAIPAVSLSTHVDFRIEHIWYLSIASVILQATISLSLLRLEFRKRLLAIT